jgi:CheY-like chemotaxis protein
MKAYRGHILVVDDYPINRQRLSHLLKQQGHTVTVAENGREAIEIINNQSLDIMLFDIIMPEMDGYQVLNYLKQNNMLQSLPVIVISALDEMDSVIQCIAMGAEDYLPKLFDPVLLKARIGACLEKKRLYDMEIKQRKELDKLNKELEVRNRFIRKTFGRYLSDDIVDTILESSEGLSLGGENRTVTIMMADLRGFTAISEQLPPEGVVNMLNNYLDVMTDIIFEYKGTIDEIIGDAILAIFGAPILFLPEKETIELTKLQKPLNIEFTIFEGKQAVEKVYAGNIVRLTVTKAEIQTQEVFEDMTNLKISLFDTQKNQITNNLYAKIERILSNAPPLFRVHFSYVPSEADSFFKTILCMICWSKKRGKFEPPRTATIKSAGESLILKTDNKLLNYMVKTCRLLGLQPAKNLTKMVDQQSSKMLLPK